MENRKLDQFYTNRNISKKCYDIISDKIDLTKYKLLEPSAGEGSFSDMFHSNSISIDIDPKKSYIVKQDFLEFEVDIKEKYVTIGNPPFGKNSSLAVKFFNKSANFSDYICFILPKTFKKDTIINRLHRNMFLIYEEVLPKNSFNYQGNKYNVPCVFQIWEKRKEVRDLIPQKRTSKYFQFTDKENADIAIRRVGGLAGKVIEDFSEYKEASHYYIKYEGSKVLDIFKKCYKDFNKVASNSSGNPSLSKHELISIFENSFFNY
jgi:hypothetical protein